MNTIPTVPVPASDQDLTPTVVTQAVTSANQVAPSECTASINIYRKAAREVIHPNQRQARRITDLISHVESARQVGADEFYGAYKMVAGRILINANNGVIEVGPGDQIAFRVHSPDDRFTGGATHGLQTAPIFMKCAIMSVD